MFIEMAIYLGICKERLSVTLYEYVKLTCVHSYSWFWNSDFKNPKHNILDLRRPRRTLFDNNTYKWLKDITPYGNDY